MEACRKANKGEESLSLVINTKPYGEVTINEDQIIDFPDGILGFDYIDKFVVLEDKDSPFVWLQAYNEPDLAFIMMSPIHFAGEYELVISGSDLEVLGTKKPEDLIVYAIITIPENDPSQMTANLQGPIIIHPDKKIGRQAISLSDKYNVRHNIMDEMKAREEKGDS